jgi:hypothetical protein
MVYFEFDIFGVGLGVFDVSDDYIVCIYGCNDMEVLDIII